MDKHFCPLIYTDILERYRRDCRSDRSIVDEDVDRPEMPFYRSYAILNGVLVRDIAVGALDLGSRFALVTPFNVGAYDVRAGSRETVRQGGSPGGADAGCRACHQGDLSFDTHDFLSLGQRAGDRRGDQLCVEGCIAGQPVTAAPSRPSATTSSLSTNTSTTQPGLSPATQPQSSVRGPLVGSTPTKQTCGADHCYCHWPTRSRDIVNRRRPGLVRKSAVHGLGLRQRWGVWGALSAPDA